MFAPSGRIRVKRKFLAIAAVLILTFSFTVYKFAYRREPEVEAVGSKKMEIGEETITETVDKQNEELLENEPVLKRGTRRNSLNYNVHIFYYPWYGSPKFDKGSYYHWNGEIIPHWNKVERDKWPAGKHVPPDDVASNFYPQLGPYSSRDPVVLDQHMKWIAQSGTGVLSVSWYPPKMTDQMGQPWDHLMPLILDAANKYELKVCFHIEPYEGRSVANLKENLKYILDTYGSHNAFYQHKYYDADVLCLQKPMFYIYDSYLIPLADWKSLLTQQGSISLRDTKLDAFFIGLLVKEEEKTILASSGFDGFYTYFAADSFTYGSTWRNWRYLQKFARKQTLIFIPSVGPGYVDERVRPWNKVNIRSRREGEYYGQFWQAALDSGTSVVSITSFNEWHEGTQIEPAVSKQTADGYTYLDYQPNGEKFYLELTKLWVDKFSEKKSNR